MAPIWPFKKKQEVLELDEAPPAPITYKKGEDPNARPPSTTVDASAYKDALALFGDGSSKVEAATDQSVNYDGVAEQAPAAVQPQLEASSDEEESFTWVHHTDGYHYKKKVMAVLSQLLTAKTVTARMFLTLNQTILELV
jgi:hypothetical protein